MRWMHDSSWAGRSAAAQIGVATFAILALEMALIRWSSGQIRLLAYFNNLILIGTFLGMGFGVALGRRYPGLVHAGLPALLVLSTALGLSETLGLVHLKLPHSIFLWSSSTEESTVAAFIGSLALIMALFLAVVATFAALGSAVGFLFTREQNLRAYSWDLGGSLAGTLATTAAVALSTPPPVWLGLGVIPWLTISRRLTSVLCGLGVLLMGAASIRGATFSPYNRIDLGDMGDHLSLWVNRDFHQDMWDFSDAALERLQASGPEMAYKNRFWGQRIYALPFTLTAKKDRALVLAAGSGNDLMGALRSGFKQVTAVDIDGVIQDLGTRLHPEKPYSDPRVVRVTNDARAFLEQYRGPPFDVVCYGLLDSHAMFSSMASLRLDNYVYTEQGLRAAWRLVAPDGCLYLSYGAGDVGWLIDRLYHTLARATGQQPILFYHGSYAGVGMVVPKPGASPDLTLVRKFQPRVPSPGETVRSATDDWPFLYLKPGAYPLAYLCVLAMVLLVALGGTRVIYRTGSRFDAPLFFMGAAFMLLETRGITALSLLCGSTWVVNSLVISGILTTALVANWIVIRWAPRRTGPWFVLLALSMLVLWAFDPGWLNRFGLLERAALGGLLNALPLGCAGVLFSILLSRSEQPDASLGSNILGAVVGGCTEYLSTVIGLRHLTLLALAIYGLAALATLNRRSRSPVREP